MHKLKLIYFPIIILLFVGCKKDPSLWHINNLNNNSIGVVGHGGSGTLYRYPMNSMNSLNHVLSMNVYGTEMDVQLSKDNKLVLYHNVNLQDGTGCSGKIAELNWEELKNCSYKLPYFSPAPLISVDDFFAQRANIKNYVYTFDTKVQVEDDKETQQNFANALYAIIQKYDLVEHCFIESYNIDFLKLLQDKNSHLKLFLHANDYPTCLEAMDYVRLYGITMDRTRISAKEIADAHQHQLRVSLFNLDTQRSNLEAIAMNPDYMQTDKADFLINALH